MAQNQLVVVNRNTDALFDEVMRDAGAGARYLDRYGPQVQEWPSGYRTLGFGEQGTEHDPASAIALASVGGLAVRAAAGESDATSVLNSRAEQVGLTLHSSTAHTALDSLSRGAGVIPALAIATNIADQESRPSLSDLLLDSGSLGVILGSSVHDGAGDNSNAVSVNALHYTNGNEIEQAAKKAVSNYVNRYFGSTIPEEYRTIHAYGALARRTNALTDPRTPGSKLYLGALVEAIDALAGNLPRNKTIEDVLHEEVYAIYQTAKKQKLAVRRPNGTPVRGGGRATPTRKRTSLEAAQLGVTQGTVKTDLTSMRGHDQVPTSYSARKAAAQEGAGNRYLDLLRNGIQDYINCQQQRIAKSRHAIARRGAIQAGVDRLCARYPYLSKENIYASQLTDKRLTETVMRLDGNVVYTTIQNAQDIGVGQEHNRLLAEAYGTASVLALGSDKWYKWYTQIAGDEEVKYAAGMHLLNNINLLLHPGPQYLDPAQLKKDGLRPEDVPYKPLPKAPLHLLVLAADVVNTNAESSLPAVPAVRLPGTSSQPKLHRVMDPAENPYAKKTWVYRRREQRLQEATAYQQRNDEIKQVTDTLGSYLTERYGVAVKDNLTLGILAECAIAEDMGFLTDPQMPVNVRERLAQRIARAFNRQRLGTYPSFHEMPQRVQQLYEATRQILGRR